MRGLALQANTSSVGWPPCSPALTPGPMAVLCGPAAQGLPGPHQPPSRSLSAAPINKTTLVRVSSVPTDPHPRLTVPQHYPIPIQGRAQRTLGDVAARRSPAKTEDAGFWIRAGARWRERGGAAGEGCVRRGGGGGGLRGGGGGVGWDPPSSQGPPMGPAEGGQTNFKLQSSWHRSKILAVSLKHWKGRRGGGSRGGGTPPSSCGVRPF